MDERFTVLRMALPPITVQYPRFHYTGINVTTQEREFACQENDTIFRSALQDRFESFF
jgi:hypothetical protein